jgi:hypothetical protein
MHCGCEGSSFLRDPRFREFFQRNGLQWLRKNSQRVIPKGWVCPRNLLFLGFGEEKQIPRFARDDKKHFFRSLFSLFAIARENANPTG